MKIIHTSAHLGEDAAQVSKKQSPGTSTTAPTVTGNPETLRAMLDCISAFREQKMPLQALVNELEFHLQSLIMADQKWQSTFFERWRELDRQQSVQLKRGRDEIPPPAMEKIDAALNDLRQLILLILSSSDTR